jgi:glycosyltransferase involved in cell wall biosynthesis
MRSARPGGVETGDAVTIVAHDVGGIGGMEDQLRELITGLLARDVAVTVVARTLSLPEHARLRWRRIPGPGRPFAIAYPWFALVASLFLIRWRSGLLHTTGAIVLNRAEVCTVHYVHGGRRGSPRRMRRATRLYRLNALVAEAMSRAGERIVYSRPALSTILVAVSEPVAVELRHALPRRAGSIRVIEHGVDTERFRPDPTARDEVRREIGIDPAVELAVFVGSDWRGKGLDVAIEALSFAPSWHLVVVGRGDADEASLLAGQLGVRPRVHLVGASSQPERFLAAADAFVLPSAYESFSLAAFEAAATGLPVLATEVGAVAEIVGAGGGAFVDRNAESVGAALRTIADSPDSAAEMSRCARRAAERFGWDTAVDKYVELYLQVGGIARIPSVGTVAE